MPAHTCMTHWATKVILSDLGSGNPEERRRLHIRLRSQTLSPEWGVFPKIRGTSLGVPIIRIIICWGTYGVPLFMETTKSFNQRPRTKPGKPDNYVLQIAFNLMQSTQRNRFVAGRLQVSTRTSTMPGVCGCQ